MKKNTLKTQLIAFIKAAGFKAKLSDNIATLTAEASNACYFATDKLDRSSVARVVCLYRAERLEQVAARRARVAGFERDVASRLAHAAEYRIASLSY